MGWVNHDIGPKLNLDENWENLINGVILKATEDLRLELRHERQYMSNLKEANHSSDWYENQKTKLFDTRNKIKVLEKFFRTSEWMTLVNVSGEYLISHIREDEKEKAMLKALNRVGETA